MKVVQPIRDKAVLTRCFEIARAHDAQRKEEDKLSWELLLVVGFNTSFRISGFFSRGRRTERRWGRERYRGREHIKF